MITYDRLKIRMIEKGITFKMLREDGTLTPNTISKLNHNKVVDMYTLIKLAVILDCDIGDIVQIKKD